MIYAIPKPTDIELIKEFLKVLKENPGIKYDSSLFEKSFISAKKNLKLVKNYPQTLSKIINATYNYLLKTGLIEKSESGVLSINKTISLNNEEEVIAYYKDYYKDLLKKIKNSNGKIDRLKLKKEIIKIANSEGRSVKESTIKKDESDLYNRILSVVNEEKEITDSYMYRNITQNYDNYKISNNVTTLDYIQSLILEKLNVKNKDMIEIIKDKILTHEFLDKTLRQNYRNDEDLFIKDINDEDLEQPDYFSNIEGMEEGSKQIQEYIEKGWKILSCGDNDGDGLNGFVANNVISKNYPMINMSSELTKLYNSKKYGKSLVNHGLTLPMLKELEEKGVFNKNEKILLITFDNFINSRKEQKRILEEYPNLKIIASDHHKFSPEEVIEENDRTIIINMEYKVKDSSLFNGFKISGSQTYIELWKNVLSKLPKHKNYEEIIQQLDTLSATSNYMDLVHSLTRIKKLHTAKELGKSSNLLNTILNLNFLWNKKDLKNYLKEEFFATEEEVTLLENKYNYLIEQSNLLLNINDKMIAGGYNSQSEMEVDLQQILVKKIELNYDKYIHPSPIYLRRVFLNLLTKYPLNSQETFLYNYIKENKILENFKEFEKDLFIPLRRNLDKIYKEYESEHATFNLIKGDVTRKFAAKLVPKSNKGILVNFDTIEKKHLGGSVRVSNDIKLSEVIEPIKEEVKKNLGIDITYHGHDFAAGFYIDSKEDLNQNKIQELIKIVSNQYKSLYLNKVSHLKYVYDPKLLPIFHKILTVLKVPSSFGNYQPEIYVKANQIPVTDDVVTDTIEENNDLSAKDGYKIANISLDKDHPVKLIVRSSDLANITNNTYLKVKYLSTDTYIVDNSVTLQPSQIEYIEYKNKMTEKQLEVYNKLYSKENNYTIDIDKKDFQNRNIIVNNWDDIEVEIKNIMRMLNIDSLTIFDTEGSGFGTFARIFNIGLLTFDKEKNGEIKIRNTSLLNDPKEKLSIAIQMLTGISNGDIKRYGMSMATADKILEKEFKNKKSLFIAHNSQYDRKIIAANFPRFSKVIEDNLLMDSAPVAREYNLSLDNREQYGTFDIKVNVGKIESYKTFLITEEDKHSLANFLKDTPFYGKKITNVSNDVSFEWVKEKDKFILIKKEISSDNKPIKMGNFGEIEYQLNPVYQAKKYSVVSMLEEYLSELIKSVSNFGEYIIEESLGLYVNSEDKVLSIDKHIDNMLDMYKGRNKFLSKDEYIKISKQFINIEELQKEIESKNLSSFNEKIKNLKNTKRDQKKKQDILNDITEEIIDRKVSYIINKIEENTFKGNYDYSSSIKRVLEVYNPYLNLESNISNINKTTTLNRSFVQSVIEKIEILNKQYSNQYKETLKEYKKESFIELFLESHNNLDYYSSDVALEGMLVIKQLKEMIKNNLVKSTIPKIYTNQVIDTESKQLLEKIRNVPTFNSYSYRQLENKTKDGELTGKSKIQFENAETLLEDNKLIIKLDVDYKLIISLNNEVFSQNSDKISKLAKRIEKLGLIIFNYKILQNTFRSYYDKLEKSFTKITKGTENIVEGLENYQDKFIKNNDFKGLKQVISEKLTPAKAKTRLETLESIESSNMINKMLELKLDREKEISSYGEFVIVEDNYKKIKTYIDLIKEAISGQISDPLLDSTLSETSFESNFEATYSSEITKKVKRNKMNPLTTITTKQEKELLEGIKKYLDKISKFSFVYITDNSINEIYQIIKSKFYEYFKVSDKVEFSDKDLKINKKTTSYIINKKTLNLYNSFQNDLNSIRELSVNCSLEGNHGEEKVESDIELK